MIRTPSAGLLVPGFRQQLPAGVPEVRVRLSPYAAAPCAACCRCPRGPPISRWRFKVGLPWEPLRLTVACSLLHLGGSCRLRSQRPMGRMQGGTVARPALHLRSDRSRSSRGCASWHLLTVGVVGNRLQTSATLAGAGERRTRALVGGFCYPVSP